MRKGWLILLAGVLILSLFANLWLGRTNLRLSAETEALQDTAARQAQDLDQLRTEAEALSDQLQTLEQDRVGLRQQVETLQGENGRLESELEVYRSYEDALEQLDRLEAQTRAIRRLVPTEAVDRSFLSPEELRAYLEETFAAEYPPRRAAADARTLSLLELLPQGVDLYGLLLNLYTEQVQGFYDLEERRLVLVGGTDLSPMQQIAFVHEYVHALQDQVYDFAEQVEALAEDSDRARALLALAEGDASLAMQQYMTDHLGELISLELLAELLLADTRQFDAAPRFVQEDMLFPYELGLLFVTDRYAARGWAGVDEVWENPPQSTEQILHPERYPEDAPQLVPMPPLTGTLGEGWVFQVEDTLGEFVLRQHLSVRLDGDQVEDAATGWGGDRYALYLHPERRAVCLALHLVWDDESEADEFARLYQVYADLRYIEGGEGTSDADGIWWDGNPGLLLQQAGDQVRIVMAPDEDTARSVAQRLD